VAARKATKFLGVEIRKRQEEKGIKTIGRKNKLKVKGYYKKRMKAYEKGKTNKRWEGGGKIGVYRYRKIGKDRYRDL